MAAGLALAMGWHAVGVVFCRSRFSAAGIRLQLAPVARFQLSEPSYRLQMLWLEIAFWIFEYELCRMGCSVNSVLQEP